MKFLHFVYLEFRAPELINLTPKAARCTLGNSSVHAIKNFKAIFSEFVILSNYLSWPHWPLSLLISKPAPSLFFMKFLLFVYQEFLAPELINSETSSFSFLYEIFTFRLSRVSNPWTYKLLHFVYLEFRAPELINSLGSTKNSLNGNRVLP